MRWTRLLALGGCVAGVATVVALTAPAGLDSAHRAGPAAARAVVARLATHALFLADRPGMPGFNVRDTPPAVDSLYRVSCVGGSFCLAIGSYASQPGISRHPALAEEWNGSAWRVIPAPPGVDSAVSCTSARFCVATGSTAQAWNGHAWRTLTGLASGIWGGVSCTSTTFCMAVGSDSSGEANLAEAWNGARWRTLKTPPEQCVPFCGLTGVACASARACVAVGSTGNDADTEDFSEGMAWNGKSWRNTPTPAPGGNSSLSGVSCASARYCVAVGNWGEESPPCDCVLAASWDGSAWHQLPTPSTGISLSSVSCPAVGECVGAGGTVTLEWKNGTWTPLTTAQPVTFLYGISCVRPASCQAVGYYVTIDGAWLTLAEQWTGGSTLRARRTPSPLDAIDGLSGVSCQSARSCVAVGSYINGSDIQRALAEKWNGRDWRTQPARSPGPLRNSLYAVSCPNTSDCMAVGTYGAAGQHQALAEQWDGATWTTQSVPHLGVLAGVSCVTVSNCVAVGSYLSGGKRLAPTATWNGTSWTVQASPDLGGSETEFTAIACPSTSDCVAVGDYNTGVATPLLPLSARWNGTVWTVLTTPAPGGADGLAAISCSRPTSCMAVGSYFHRHGHDFPIRTLAESWNGSHWRVRTTPVISGQVEPHLAAISCPASARTGPARCLAVGGYLDAAGQGFTLAESWNGTTWSLLPIPSTRSGLNDLYGLSCPTATRCTAVGEKGVQHTSSYLWNGTAWSSLSTPSP